MDKSLIPLIASVMIPLLGFVVSYRNSRQDPGAIRKMRRHAQLLEMLPEAARPSLESLLVSEVEQYSTRQGRKYKRKLDGAAVAALIFVGLILGLVLYGLLWWAIAWNPAWYIFGAVALVGILFMGVGMGQLFKAEEPPEDQTSE